MIDDFLAFVVVVVVVFVVGVVTAGFDSAVSADVAVVVFHLVVVILAFFVVAAVISDFQIVDVDSAFASDFSKVFADYFGDLDDVVKPALCRLHWGVLVNFVVFL